MSNHRAIAAVTATLRRTLQEALLADGDVAGVTVSTRRPPAPTDEMEPSLNIFLYQVTPNVALRNLDLPTRRHTGQLLTRPIVALDLHYLFTFLGDEARLEPQLMLGTVARTLHARPLLTPETIAQTVSDPLFSFVADSDLAVAVESVKLTPSAMSLEDLSRLWSVFFQVPYSLSLAYDASVVLIDQPVAITHTALPVRSTVLKVTQLKKPIIEHVLARSAPAEPFVEGAPVVPESTLSLRGKQLLGDDSTVVLLGNAALTPTLTTPEEVRVELPATIRAGTHRLAIAHTVGLGAPVEQRRVLTSDSVSFVLAPLIESQALAPTEIVVAFAPAVTRTQQLTLTLRGQSGSAGGSVPGAVVEAPARPASDPPETSQVSFPRPALPAGEYLLILQVDGANSPLEFDSALGRYVGPSLSIP